MHGKTALITGGAKRVPDSSALRLAQDQFVLEWARMSSSWGINRTMAQIHALLFISSEELSVDDIIERLRISRGNASMSLRDLMDWGIVRRFRRPGERKDLYASESDPLTMFARVVRERKRREIDPTAGAIRECIGMLPENETSEEATIFRSRLQGLLEIFDLMDAVYRQMLSTDRAVQDSVAQFSEQTQSRTKT